MGLCPDRGLKYRVRGKGLCPDRGLKYRVRGKGMCPDRLFLQSHSIHTDTFREREREIAPTRASSYTVAVLI